MKWLATGIGFILFFSSCSKEEFQSGSSDYFPLSTGNYWQLGDRLMYEVKKSEELGGKNYYLVSTGYDSTWYRVHNQKVYAIQNGTTKEEVIFNLAAREGNSWSFNDYTVTLQSRREEITFRGQKVTDCYLFFVDDPRMADEEYWIWLAPGIGFIQYRCSFCINPVSTLKKARVNGVEW